MSPKTILNSPVNGEIQELFKANLIFKVFSRQSSIFKYFSSLCEPWNSKDPGKSVGMRLGCSQMRKVTKSQTHVLA